MPSLLLGDLGTPELLIIGLMIAGMLVLAVLAVVLIAVTASRGRVGQGDTTLGRPRDSDH
jgi:hypothetical protein